MGIYPYSGSGYDKYWKYENPDPSTDPYALRVALEVVDEALLKIRKRGTQIYDVRPAVYYNQDLVHAVIRLLPGIFTEHIKQIEKYEKENSGDIRNYTDTEDGEGGGEDFEDGEEGIVPGLNISEFNNLSLNEAVGFYYNIGANPIPVDSETKRPLLDSWEQWQHERIPPH